MKSEGVISFVFSKSIEQQAAMTRSRALFLDRDGVINRDDGYVHRREDFVFMEGVFDLTRRAVAAGYLVIVVTNQSGIARGYFREADFYDLTAWMLREFERRDAPLTAVYHCPFHPEGRVAAYRRDHPWRKPRPGMILQAAADFDLDLERSLLVGDQPTDLQAGRSAGIGRRYLVGAQCVPPEESCECANGPSTVEDLSRKLFRD
ncbi:D-glycero-alpha-D-manno-heptose-1,7-bisphosphate 7-phosphatase [Alsobacter sp. R-9]